MKKLFTIITGLFLMLGMVVPAHAAPPTFAGGTLKYTAYSAMQRHATFNVTNFGNSCLYGWNATGNFVVDFLLNGDPTIYAHDAFLTQTGNSVSGNGGHPVGGPFAYDWDITNGTVTGNSINLEILYDLGAPGTIMTMNGTIAPDGSMSGTWTDNFGGTRNGTWTTSSGAAVEGLSGCTGSGIFSYKDAAKNYYLVDVQHANISGNTVWFAGPVVLGNIGAGQWLFAKVEDGGIPVGLKKDKISGSFTTEAAAKLGVATMANPADGPFTSVSGNFQIH